MHPPILLMLFVLLSNVYAEEFTKMYSSKLRYIASLFQDPKIGGNRPIKTILDVGANQGDWTKLCKPIFTKADFFMIEGNPKLSKFLDGVGSPYRISLVGDEKKEVEFHVHRLYSTGGSIFQEHNYKYKQQKAIHHVMRQMDRIDNILKAENISQIDLLKMDIQGAEFIALQGATETLKDTQLVLLEVALHQYNPGAHSFADINTFLESQGFRMFEVLDLRSEGLYENSPPGLVQMDVMWAKADGPLFKNSQYPSPPESVYTHTLKEKSH